MIFTKKDLKTGMLLTDREGKKYLFLSNFKHLYDNSTDILLNINENEWSKLDSFDDNLNASNGSLRDIMKVEVPKHCYSILDIFNKNNEIEYQKMWVRLDMIEEAKAEFEKKFNVSIQINK